MAGRPLIVAGCVAALVASAACGGGGPAAATSAPAPTTAAEQPAPPAAVTTAQAGGVEATLSPSAAAPQVNVPWTYGVRVTDGSGATVKATITVQIVDPLQQAHPVEWDDTKKKLVDWPIDGTFEDRIIWPSDSRGFPLTLRIIVSASGETVTLTYPVRVG
jgi:hypothetical protein